MKRVEVDPVWSPRNDRFASFYRLHLVIELQHTAAENAAIFAEPSVTARTALRQSFIHSKVSELIDVYSVNYQSCGFYLDDGTKTRHSLTNGANNISGNRVLYRSWDKDGGDEFATVRSAYVVVGGLFDEADSGIYAYQETIQKIGTGGPVWEWVRNQGAPVQRQIYPFSQQRIIQRGSIVGTTGWALGNVPPPLFPALEHGERRIEEYEYPKWHGNQYRLYGYSWSYFMEAPTGVAAIPNIY